jgi:hypothetical protein
MADGDGTVRPWPRDVETLRARLRAASNGRLAPSMRQRYMGVMMVVTAWLHRKQR